eukprot:m.22210 g.22210  ORF g.22210 m.22210 type:complete len:139 (+) comp13724_c0_seq1:271-687(+)
MAHATTTSIRALLSRFKRVRETWPVVEERIGRDLGQYIKGSYSTRLKDAASKAVAAEDAAQVSMLEREVVALEKLSDNAFKNKYQRSTDSTFMGDAGKQFYSKLSTKAQKDQNTQGYWDKLFGRKIQSQHNPKTASRD